MFRKGQFFSKKLDFFIATADAKPKNPWFSAATANTDPKKVEFPRYRSMLTPKQAKSGGISQCHARKAGFTWYRSMLTPKVDFPWYWPILVTRECSFFGLKSTLCPSNLYFAV